MVDKNVDSVDNIRALVLSLVKQNYSPSKIAKLRKVSRQAVYKLFKKFLGEGLIVRRNDFFELTEGGLQVVDKFLVVPKSGCLSDGTFRGELVRLHDLCFNVRILSAPSDWVLRNEYVYSFDVSSGLPINLLNTSQFEFRVCGVRVRITSKSVLVYVPELVGRDLSVLMNDALNVLFEVIPKVEAKFPVVLLDKGGQYCDIRVTRAHSALMENELAKKYVKEKRCFRVLAADGKVRLLIDFSHGVPEFEAVSPRSFVGDINACQPFFEDLVNHNEAVRMSDIKGVMKEIVDNVSVLLQAQQVTVQVLNSLLPKPEEKGDVVLVGRPDYFG